MTNLSLCGLSAILLLLPATSQAADVSSQIARIKAVGREGNGNVEAARAWRELVREGPEVLIDILSGLQDASPTAANWLRAAVDAIAERTLAAGQTLPAARLEAFVRETQRNGPARRLA